MKIIIEIPEQLIVDTLDAADIGYWATVHQCAATKKLLEGKSVAKIVEIEGSHDGSGDGRHELTGAKVAAGIQAMVDKHPTHFADMMDGGGDCTTGDVLIQLALFGDIIYG